MHAGWCFASDVSERAKLYLLRPSRLARFLYSGLFLFAAACSGPSGQKPVLEYDQTGRLTKVFYDANKNGTNESTSLMDGTRIVRVELDYDENGKTERWDIYNEDRTLQKVGLASRNDGVMDSQAFYSSEGVMTRIEVSTARDGRFNRTEYYDAAQRLTHSEEDTNADGRVDKWETYAPVAIPKPELPPYTITSTAFDETGKGRPTRRLIFGPQGSIVGVEIDPDGDGVFARLTPPSAVAKR